MLYVNYSFSKKMIDLRMLRFSRWLLVVICLFSIDARASYADTGVVPESLVLDQRWNYNDYTHMVIPTINWLQSTPLDTNTGLRTRHDNFLMYWLQKNEQVVVHMPEYLLRFQNANRELYFIYAGGWIKTCFRNRRYYSSRQCHCCCTKCFGIL